MKKFVQLISVALLAFMCVSLLASCVPASNPDKAVAALQKAGYKVEKEIVDEDDPDMPFDNVTSVVIGAKDNDELDGVTIIYFASASDASKAYKTSELKQLYEDQIKRDNKDVELVYARFGKIVYIGTKDAIKAAR